MHCKVSDLRSKEIINVNDGMRFGYVNDVELDTVSGKIIAIVVPGDYKFFGMFGKGEDFIIPWESIKRIGDDIILVDFESHYVRGGQKGKKTGGLFM